MRNLFCSYEQSKKIRKLGFNEPCMAVYVDDKLTIADKWINSTNNDTFIKSKNFTAPLKCQFLEWASKNYFVYCEVVPDTFREYFSISFHIKGKPTQIVVIKKDFETIKEQCIDFTIHFIKEKKTKK